MFALIDDVGTVYGSGASEAECLADAALRHDGQDVGKLGRVVSCVSFKPEFFVGGSWATNAQRFATYQEAFETAAARFMVWTVPSAYRAGPSDDPVTCKRVDGRDVYPG